MISRAFEHGEPLIHERGISTIMPGAPGDSLAPDRWLGKAIWFFVCLGLALRLGAYLQNFPLWWDEAFVAVNFLRRDYLDLIRPLDYGQVGPLLFLWVELAVVKSLGFSEWSLRLFPLVCALASVVLYRTVAMSLLRGRALLMAVAIFSVSVHPIRHAADVKPYASDLLVALILVYLTIRWSIDRNRPARLWALVSFVPIALLLSHPSAFVIGGIGLVIAWPAWRTRVGAVRAAWLAYGFVSLVSYATIFLLFTRPQASAASPAMKEMWVRSFPPLNSVLGLARWLGVVHSGDLLAYPCGGENGASLISLLACVLGAIYLTRRRQWLLLGILLGPLVPAMVAAGLRLYPYGGPAPHGSSARVMQYIAPSLCLLIGLGVSRIMACVQSRAAVDRILRIACLGLVAVGVVPLAIGTVRPYRAYHAEAAREFARRFWPEVSKGAEVACLRWDEGVAEWDSIRLGIAVSLCNEAIYSPSRRSGGPSLSLVSDIHPLRCVLGVAPNEDSTRMLSWLDRMRVRYEIRRRDTYLVPTAEPSRGASPERYEVFEFVPKSPMTNHTLTTGPSVSGD